MTSPQISTVRKKLESHREDLANAHLRDLFATDPDRFGQFSLKLDGVLLDYSKNRITGDTVDLLLDLATAAGIEDGRRRLFAGERINASEDRAALHPALRDPAGELTGDAGADIAGPVSETLSRMRMFTDAVRSGAWTGATGKAITDVINIGIGGSHTAPEMAVAALGAFHSGPRLHFVSNLDGVYLGETLAGLDPETTLVIAASKSFTTQETLANAATARDWLAGSLGADGAGRHLIAITANGDAAGEFGVAAEGVFPIWDWVGGRYSLCSAGGLAVALAVGMDHFEAMLAGAHAMDRHFLETPLAGNLPVMLALIGIWNINFLGAGSLAVLPYGYRLRHLPRFLQQLEMEGNGKAAADGSATAPIVFGEAGSDGQHTFYQLLHQGTPAVACDFIAAIEPDDGGGSAAHAKLLANFLAQSEALMAGRLDEPEGSPRAFAGNRPSNSIILDRLDPHSLGMLIALYEHKVFVQGLIWGVNSFDQWGVELGKELTERILPELNGEGAGDHDSSTAGLLAHIKRLKS
jgi:glucose-6-phosphate isomerase